MALLAIVEAIVDGLVFSQDEDVVAQWTSMLFFRLCLSGGLVSSMYAT